MDPELNRYIKLLVKMSIFLLAILIIHLIVRYILPIIEVSFEYILVLALPFLLALLLAVIIEPLVRILHDKLKLKRSLAVLFSLLLFVGGFSFLVSWLITSIIKELSKILPGIILYSDQILQSLFSSIGDFRFFFLQFDLPLEIEKAMQSSLDQGIKYLSTFFSSSIDVLTQSLAVLPGAFAFIIIAAIATFYISKDRYQIKQFIYKLLPVKTQNKTTSIFKELVDVLWGFLKAITILTLITTGLTILLLAIIGLDYVVTIGIFVGFLDLLPILGPGLFFVPWILIEFVIGNTKLGIMLLIVYIIISAVRQFMQPRIIGDNIGLHPLVTLIALYVGLTIWGAVGLILGPLVFVIIISCYRVGLFDNLIWRLKKTWKI